MHTHSRNIHVAHLCDIDLEFIGVQSNSSDPRVSFSYRKRGGLLHAGYIFKLIDRALQHTDLETQRRIKKSSELHKLLKRLRHEERRILSCSKNNHGKLFPENAWTDGGFPRVS